MSWWETFFDADYERLWGGSRLNEDRSAAEAEGLWSLLALSRGQRVLDAPCGSGRLARRLAQRGVCVVGVDQSEALLVEAEAQRGELSPDSLTYLRHDLRHPLPATLSAGSFDAAYDVFSSVGYGEEPDDLAVFATLRGALRAGGLLVVETMHRDALVALLARGLPQAFRLPDGTLLVEEVRFDPIAGRSDTTWFYSGPSGQGERHASIRVYAATELVRLTERAGFRFLSAHAGLGPSPFTGEGPLAGGRLGLLFEAT